MNKKFYLLSLTHTSGQGAARLWKIEKYVNSGKGFDVVDIMTSTPFFSNQEPFDIYELVIDGENYFIHEKDGLVLDVN